MAKQEVKYRAYTIKFNPCGNRWGFAINLGHRLDCPPVNFGSLEECQDFAEAYVDDLINDVSLTDCDCGC